MLPGAPAKVQPEIDFIMVREEEAGTLQRMREAGQLPLRVTHNDTKLNNVLLDKKTRKALCVLDLDTVMPGLSLYDFGDSIRFGAASAPEDEKDLSKMELNLHLFEIYTKGYLKACPSLTPEEIDMMPMGAKIITLELATPLPGRLSGRRLLFQDCLSRAQPGTRPGPAEAGGGYGGKVGADARYRQNADEPIIEPITNHRRYE